jgi:YfiH family protein
MKPPGQKPRRKAAPRRRPPHRRAAAPVVWSTHSAMGIDLLRSVALARLEGVAHAFTTRKGGGSALDGERVLNLGSTEWDTEEAVQANRARLAEAMGAQAMTLVTLRQRHTDIIHVVGKSPRSGLRGDALITKQPGLLLAVQTADCVPILLADTRRNVVAAVHAGWRGTLRRIVQKTIGRMRMEMGTRPRDLLTVLGPAIGRCCYEVGPEVVTAFAAQFDAARDWFDGPFQRLARGEEPTPLPWLSRTPPGHPPPAPRACLDLQAANRWQLLDAGVPARAIVTIDLCTACRTDLLFSHRRERGRTGRMMAVIGIRPHDASTG